MFVWTGRRQTIGDTLANRVARATTDQFTRYLGPAARDIRLLVGAGYVAKRRVLGVDELDLQEPVVNWTPGDRAPDFNAVSRHLQSRWTQRPKAMTVLVATPKLTALFGGYGGKIKVVDQARHDLHVAQIYLRLLTRDPEAAALWTSEAELSHERRRFLTQHPPTALLQKTPDGVLVSATGEWLRVIDFAGAYPATRCASLHRFCWKNGYPYELW
jgi:hypothetical protein